MTVVYSAGAVVAGSRMGSSVTNYLTEKERFTGLTAAATIAITHGADPENKRVVKVLNTATKKVLDGAEISVVHTSDTVTTIANLTGATLAGEVHLSLAQ